jgi:hypothetical protein
MTNSGGVMGLDIILNPKGIESTYIDYLNLSFGHWGDTALYKWCFDRQIGDLKADIMILKQDEKIIAGSAVTYRKALLGKSVINVGIMTGSWTLPEARGQGRFTKIIEESLSLASHKGTALLIAFLTESNASFRRLANAGSSLFPTHYLFSDHNTPIPESSHVVSPVSDIKKGLETIFENLRKRQDGFAHFTYTLKEWESQFWERPGEMEFLHIGDIGLAIIEKKGDFDRVLFLSLQEEHVFADCIKALLKKALENGQKLFLFTTSLLWKDECLKLGFSRTPGYLTALIADENELIKIYPGASCLPENIAHEYHKPVSPWYIGSWDIQSGDRM